MRTFIILILLVLVLFLIFRSPKTVSENAEVSTPEELLEIDLSLGDENGEPLPQ